MTGCRSRGSPRGLRSPRRGRRPLRAANYRTGPCLRPTGLGSETSASEPGFRPRRLRHWRRLPERPDGLTGAVAALVRRPTTMPSSGRSVDPRPLSRTLLRLLTKVACAAGNGGDRPRRGRCRGKRDRVDTSSSRRGSGSTGPSDRFPGGRTRGTAVPGHAARERVPGGDVGAPAGGGARFQRDRCGRCVSSSSTSGSRRATVTRSATVKRRALSDCGQTGSAA